MFNLEEQEQVDAIKAWWKQHGNSVIMALTVFVAVLASIQGWRYYQNSQAQQAAVLYDVLQNAAQSGDTQKIRNAAGQIIEKFARTPYAARSALVSARANYEAGDIKSAQAQLQWVIDNGKEDAIKDVARLRLAGVMLDEKNMVGALKLLESKHSESYDAIYADFKGDVLTAQDKTDEARKSYAVALEKTDIKSPFRKYIQIKQDSLGEAK